MPSKKRVVPPSPSGSPSSVQESSTQAPTKLPSAQAPASGTQAASASEPTASSLTEGAPEDPWQKAHDALEDALEVANRALDQSKDAGYRSSLNLLIDALSDELTAINQDEIKEHTISLEAAGHELKDGIQSLTTLQHQLNEISAEIATAAEVVTAVGGAVSGLKSMLSSFPIL